MRPLAPPAPGIEGRSPRLADGAPRLLMRRRTTRTVAAARAQGCGPIASPNGFLPDFAGPHPFGGAGSARPDAVGGRGRVCPLAIPSGAGRGMAGSRRRRQSGARRQPAAALPGGAAGAGGPAQIHDPLSPRQNRPDHRALACCRPPFMRGIEGGLEKRLADPILVFSRPSGRRGSYARRRLRRLPRIAPTPFFII